MRISEVASFLVRRLLPHQRSRIKTSTAPSFEVLTREVYFEAADSALEALHQDYSALKERLEILEAFQKFLIQSPQSDFSWPSFPPLATKDPSIQALWDLIELRALILQEQAKCRRAAQDAPPKK